MTTTHAREMYGKFPIGESSQSERRDKMDALLIKYLSALPRTAKVYDIGCGVGHFLELCVRQGVPAENLSAVDLAPENIERIKAKGFQGEVGNVLELPTESEVSDFTLSQGVIHHTADSLKAFGELARITRPGGQMYVNLYYFWNPYYFFVHRLTVPLRWLYWNAGQKWMASLAFGVANIFLQPLAYVAFGHFLDRKQAYSVFMDQVMTPVAETFTRGKLERYARVHGCEPVEFELNRYAMMIAAVFRKAGQASSQ